MKVHEETRRLPIFALVVASAGPKLREVKPDDTEANGIKRSGSGLVVSNGKIVAKGVSMDELATQLTGTSTLDHKDFFVGAGHFAEVSLNGLSKPVTIGEDSTYGRLAWAQIDSSRTYPPAIVRLETLLQSAYIGLRRLTPS